MEEQKTEEQQDSHLPAPYGVTKEVESHLQELADSIPAVDPIIKMAERKNGFEVDEEEVAEILGMKINVIDGYFGEWDGSSGEMELIKHPLDEPQPVDSEERGELGVTWRGEDFIFSLPPTGWRAFSRFFTKWQRRGCEVVGATLHARSKLVKTKSGYLVNIPKFVMVQPGNMDPNTINAEVEPADDIPF